MSTNLYWAVVVGRKQVRQRVIDISNLRIWALTRLSRQVCRRRIAGDASSNAAGLLPKPHSRPPPRTVRGAMAETRLAFKAGRAFRRGNTNFVDPDPAKGAILLQNGEDGLLHFIWKNRTNNDAEEVRCGLLKSFLNSNQTVCCKGPHPLPRGRDFSEGRAICVGSDVRPQVLFVKPTALRTSLPPFCMLRMLNTTL